MIEKEKNSFSVKELEDRIEETFLVITKRKVEIGIIPYLRDYDDNTSFNLNNSNYYPYIPSFKSNLKNLSDRKAFFDNYGNKVFFYVKFGERDALGKNVWGFYDFTSNTIMLLMDSEEQQEYVLKHEIIHGLNPNYLETEVEIKTDLPDSIHPFNYRHGSLLQKVNYN